MQYREDLDNLVCECGTPVCEDPVVFHSQCHFGKPTWTGYFDGEVKVFCSVCNEEIVSIAVARRTTDVAT